MAGSGDARVVVLDCVEAKGVPPASTEALCAALTDALAGSEPAWSVSDRSDAPAVAPRITLTLLSATDRELHATLAWRADGADGASPQMLLNVVDTTLRPEMFAGFARTLLRKSNWPLG